jgi:hypothetical protein
MMFKIVGFDNVTEWVAAEFDLSPEVTIPQLRSAFGMIEEADIWYEWPISPEVARSLAPYLDQVLREPEHAWFLSPCAETDSLE